VLQRVAVCCSVLHTELNTLQHTGRHELAVALTATLSSAQSGTRVADDPSVVSLRCIRTYVHIDQSCVYESIFRLVTCVCVCTCR